MKRFFIYAVGLIGLCLAGVDCNQNNSVVNVGKTDTLPNAQHSPVHQHGHRSQAGDSSMANMAGMQMDNSEQEDTTDPSYWNALPTNHTVIANQQVVKPILSSIDYVAHANGYITIDSRRNKKVVVRTAGRIDRLYVRYNYQHIHKGEKIFELYSPEMNTYVEEYIFLLRGQDSVMISKAKQKLLLLGLSNGQINQMARTGNVTSTISVYSPLEGYVLFNPSPGGNMPATTPAVSGMGTMTSTANSNMNTQFTSLPDNSIREGMYLNKDQTIFWVNDFRQLLGVLAFNKIDEKYIRHGQTAVVESELLPDQRFRSPIELIEPVYEKGQRFTQARVYLNNNSKVLRQNSLLTASVFIDAHALLIPQSSVQYLGRIAIVWVKVASTKDSANVFQARTVRLGRPSNDMIEVVQGLKEDEWIAKDGSYLTDSETIIKYEK